MITQQVLSEIMTTDLVTIHVSETVHEMLDLMVANNVTTLPVVSAGDRCVGMVSLGDLLEATSESAQMLDDNTADGADDIFDRLWVYDRVRERLGGERIEEVMSHSAIWLHADATVEQAAELMLQNNIHHLAIVKGDEQLVGLVSSMDLLNVLAPNVDRRSRRVVHHHNTESAEAYESARPKV